MSLTLTKPTAKTVDRRGLQKRLADLDKLKTHRSEVKARRDGIVHQIKEGRLTPLALIPLDNELAGIGRQINSYQELGTKLLDSCPDADLVAAFKALRKSKGTVSGAVTNTKSSEADARARLESARKRLTAAINLDNRDDQPRYEFEIRAAEAEVDEAAEDHLAAQQRFEEFVTEYETMLRAMIAA